jgi:hypothetical protein
VIIRAIRGSTSVVFTWRLGDLAVQFRLFCRSKHRTHL